MKLTEAFKFVVREAKCPTCGADNAYHGFSSVECPNPKCMHYDPEFDKQQKDKDKSGSGVIKGQGQFEHAIDKLKVKPSDTYDPTTGRYTQSPGNKPDIYEAHGPSLWDNFSKTKDQFKKNIRDAATDTFGDGWEEVIDYSKVKNGKSTGPRWVDKMLDRMWDNNWSDSEAQDEITFELDNAMKDDQSYDRGIDPYNWKKYEFDDTEDDYVERKKRPMSPNDF